MRILFAAAAIPAALAIVVPLAHADDAPNPNCAIGETEAAFAVNDLVDIAGDTGWFPSNFVAQLKLTAKVQSHTNVSTAYRATACWDGEMKAGLEGIPGSGYLDVAYGAELALYGRIHTTVLGYDINWEGQIPIPWIPEDLLIEGAGTFQPRLDTGGIYVEDLTAPATVLSTDAIAQFISVGGISGGLYVTVQGGMRSTYRAKKVSFNNSVVDSLTDQISIDQPSGGFHSTVSLPLAIDGTIRYAPTLTFAAGLDISIFGIRVVDWQFGSISANLPGIDRNIKLTAQPVVVPLPELDGVGDGARMDFESASTQFLHIKNTGEGPLTLTPFAVPSGIQVVGVTLQGKEESDLRVTVSEGALAAGSTTLNFTTNDPDRPNVSIQLGMAVGGTDPGTPPVIEEPEAGGCSSSRGGHGLAMLLLAAAFARRRRKA